MGKAQVKADVIAREKRLAYNHWRQQLVKAGKWEQRKKHQAALDTVLAKINKGSLPYSKGNGTTNGVVEDAPPVVVEGVQVGNGSSKGTAKFDRLAQIAERLKQLAGEQAALRGEARALVGEE